MRNVKIVSFDLEGTLVDTEFSRLVWEEALPVLYAEERGISLEDALKQVIEEYNRVGPERVEWYDLRYWFKHFELRADWRSLLERFKDFVAVYPEVGTVLDRLSRSHKLIIITNTSRDFLLHQMKPLNPCFTRIFSAPTDYGTVKSPELYTKICKELNVKPQEVVHVGDHRIFDYTAPREVGITAYLLERTGKEQGEHTIRDLEELELRLLESKGTHLAE